MRSDQLSFDRPYYKSSLAFTNGWPHCTTRYDHDDDFGFLTPPSTASIVSLRPIMQQTFSIGEALSSRQFGRTVDLNQVQPNYLSVLPSGMYTAFSAYFVSRNQSIVEAGRAYYVCQRYSLALLVTALWKRHLSAGIAAAGKRVP
jgi:hypothetical protein